MATQHSPSNRHPVGRIFTPLEWAMWLVDKSGVFTRWEEGASVFDPTSGDGVFLEAFIALAVARNSFEQGSMARLHGNEIMTGDHANFLSRVEERYAAQFPELNLTSIDFFLDRFPKKFDCVVGNPPWGNFADLPSAHKEGLKRSFESYGLVRKRSAVLLGNSRADVAALTLQKVVSDNLNDQGLAAFWLPCSLFFNEGANRLLREFSTGETEFCCDQVFLFDREPRLVFPDIGTRYLAATFTKGTRQTYPVPAYQVRCKGEWQKTVIAPPAVDLLGGWQEWTTAPDDSAAQRPHLSPAKRPRQGVNTCGATDVFVFDSCTQLGSQMMRLDNKKGRSVVAPADLVFPLVSHELFSSKYFERRDCPIAKKWVVLPYDRISGKPLRQDQLDAYPSLSFYFQQNRERLADRKGVLIQAQVKKGAFWAMLGVGRYTFSPWKVIWESYGRKTFRPIKVSGEWQGNQAMHAYIPCDTEEEADEVMEKFGSINVERELLRHGMAGTANWAQPGRISRLFDYSETGPGRSDAVQGALFDI
jgi:hypothetical protein